MSNSSNGAWVVVVGTNNSSKSVLEFDVNPLSSTLIIGIFRITFFLWNLFETTAS